MRNLTLQEQDVVSAGTLDPITMTVGIAAVCVGIAIINAFTRSPICHTVLQPQDFLVEEITPLYDAYGNQVGEKVDTYIETQMVEVIECH